MPGKFNKILLFMLLICLSMPVFAAEENAGPKRQLTLTEEQKAQGYELINGYAYSPEDLAGQPGRTAYSVKQFAYEDEGLSNVTFNVDMQSGINTPVILYFVNADTYQEYYIDLYPSNNYSRTVRVAPGNYYFTGGGPENDYMSLFQVVDPDYFMVEYNTATAVNVTIRSKGTIVQQLENMIESDRVIYNYNQIMQPDKVIVPEKEPKTRSYYLKVALILIGISVLIIGGIIFKYKQEKRIERKLGRRKDL